MSKGVDWLKVSLAIQDSLPLAWLVLMEREFLLLQKTTSRQDQWKYLILFSPLVFDRHPHQWSERRVYNMYSFGSSSAPNQNSKPRSVGLENFITHNGDFEFLNVNGKCYDIEVVQTWLENVLDTAMPATVDSGKIVYYL